MICLDLRSGSGGCWLSALNKVAPKSVGKFISTSTSEVKKAVEAVGKCAIRSYEDVKLRSPLSSADGPWV